jgi:integrase
MAKPRPEIYEIRKSNPYQGKEWRVIGYVDGKRRQHWFESEKEAKIFANGKNKERAKFGTEFVLLPSQRADAIAALELLKPYDRTLTEVIKLYVESEKSRLASKPLDEFIREYKAEREEKVKSDELRPGSQKAIKETFVKLIDTFGSKNLADISTENLEEWLAAMPLAGRTKKRHRAYALQIFNAALRKRLIKENPAKNLDGYRNISDEEVTFLSPEKLKELLSFADKETYPLYALAAYAGVRWAEIEKLNWENIKETEIVITSANAKTRSRRVVDIRPILAEILQPCRHLTGSVLPKIFKVQRPSHRRLDFLRKAAETKAGLFPFPEDILRHSYISYLYALTGNENYVATQAGNTPAVIFKNYRALVTKAEAEKYFAEPAFKQFVKALPDSENESGALISRL